MIIKWSPNLCRYTADNKVLIVNEGLFRKKKVTVNSSDNTFTLQFRVHTESCSSHNDYWDEDEDQFYLKKRIGSRDFYSDMIKKFEISDKVFNKLVSEGVFKLEDRRE